jgi:hypothetical protein
MAYVRIHQQTLMKADPAIHHCYPRGQGLVGKVPKCTYMTPFWQATYAILRNTIAIKFGEKTEARAYMINLLYHIMPSFWREKKIDVLDYMWEEMHTVILDKRVPIYGPYLQQLFDRKVPQIALNAYLPTLYTPVLHSLPSRPPDAVIPTQEQRASTAVPETQAEPAKKHGILDVFKRMNCFFAEKQDKDYKIYHKQKSYNRNQREIMKQLNFPEPSCPSSDEVSENTYKSKNTFWFGDDASSLAPHWPGTQGESSSGQAVGGGNEDDIVDWFADE